MSPASSERQRRACCLALSVKLGKRPPNGVSPEIRRMAKEMTIEDLSDYCRQPIKEK